MLQRICWSVRDGSRLRLVRKKRRMVRPQFRMDGRYSDVWLLVLSERSGPDQFQMRLVGDLVVTVGEEVPTTDLLSKRIGVREGKPGAEPERSRGKELHHDGTAWSFAPRHLSGRPTSPASVKFMRWRLASDCGRFVWLLPFLSPSPRAPGRRSCPPNPCRVCSPHWRREQTGRWETRFWGSTGGSTDGMWGTLPINHLQFRASPLLHLQV